MADVGHERTEKALGKIERRVSAVYLQAFDETQAKLDDYMSRFAAKDAIMRDRVKRGEVTPERYTQWRHGQICMGKRWQEMVDTLAADYSHANQIAMSIINGHLPDVYALNHNYAAYVLEHDSKLDLSFTLYDRQTVERLIRDNPNLLPKASVDIPMDKRWNKQKINNAVTQGILQGEDIRKISARLRKVTDMNHSAAVRNARTMTTGAENAGRLDAFNRAKDMGIDIQMEWLATLDGRTRHSHRQLDGKRIPMPKDKWHPSKFPNGCKYPGDPEGPPWEVYNCRCTLVPYIAGVDQSNAPRNDKLGGMTYDEWKNAKKPRKAPTPEAPKPEEPTVQLSPFQAKLGAAKTVSEVNDVINSQGWFRPKLLRQTQWDNANGKLITTTVPNDKADLTGCSLECAKSIANSYEQVFKKYPQLIGKFHPVDAQPIGMGYNTYAWCYISHGGRVQVNPKRFKDYKALRDSYESDVLSGWHPYGTTAESIVTHEIGHAIDGYITSKHLYNTKGFASGAMKQGVMKSCGYTAADTASAVSRYASKNAQEWFAECFAEYITSANPRPVAVAFGKKLEELLARIEKEGL